jgi:hypothetical protein
MSKNGKDVGADYASRMQAYPAERNRLPVSKSGAINIKAIAEVTYYMEKVEQFSI